MNAAKDCTLQEKLLRCAMALILAAGALLASVAASPAYAAPGTVDVSIGGKIPYGGFATTWMSADGNIAYCAEPSSPTPAPGSYSTSPVPSGDVTAAIWYSFGSPGFDASMFPGSWYDGGGWDDAKYAAASHVLIAYAYSGSESAATHGTSAEFASWAKSELIGGTYPRMKAGAGKVSAGFEAFCVRTGGGSQTLVSFSWSAGGVKVAKTDSEAGAEPQGDASLDGASFSVVNETGRYVLVGGEYYADGEVCATIKTAPEDGSHVAATGADALPAGNYRIVESGAPEGYGASDASVAFTVKGGEVRDLTGDPVTDEVFRGGVQVTKSDKELQASEALAGSGHKEAPGEHPGLDGIEFTVTNRSAHKVLVDGEWREPGEAVATVPADPGSGYFGRLMGWADKFRKLKVRTNADTPADAKKARELGAEGIGLCRTEHMFFEEDRIAAFREMICSDTVEEREAALEKILPYQQGDFEKLYEALEGCPVTIRFLDPPLHEFVPTEEEDIKKLADAQGKSVEQIKAIIASLHEFNPMMGHRGLRLAVTYPEIAKMQTKAVIRAAINVQKAHPEWTVAPEIMIPLSCDAKELKYVKDIVVATADAEIAAAGSDMKYEVGTMIEIPRAALTAGDIAKEAEFFCFGTNDLTQMTYGFSRDDAGKFLNAYYDAKIFESDPFAKLDQTGVGQLMEMAVKNGKATRPSLHCGICGEHGGDPSSVEFCHKIGLDYVSCSPFRVPIARLAAAQAAIAEMD